MDKMHQHIIDLKVSLAIGLYAFVSFSNVEIAMKIVAFFLTVGYTARRWYLLEKKNRNED